jgi:hypothetical protein
LKIIGKGWYTGPRNYNTGAGFGISISKIDRDKLFAKEWKFVILKLDGFRKEIRINIDKPSFWNECPELIKAEIGVWFKENGVMNWPKYHPPQVEIEQIKNNYFKVKLLNNK